MQKRTLGSAGIEVSRLGLGTATWGFPGTEDDAVAQLRLYADAGGTLIDTANIYGNGESERIIGDVLAKVRNREDFVLATKAGLVPGKPPLRIDSSRARMLSELDNSLRRLRVDYIDLWQVHTWDDRVPIEETLDAIDIAISAGKVRAAGVSNFQGWQIRKAAACQQACHRPPLATAQMEYSLIQRGIEVDVLPAARECELGILAWAPLGRGVLTGKYRTGIPDEKMRSRFFRWYVKRYAVNATCARIVESVAYYASQLGVSPIEVALSWVRDRPRVVAPLVGARSVRQLAESLKAETLELPEDVRTHLETVSAASITEPTSWF